MEHEGVLFRGKVQCPQDVDDREDEPASSHGVPRSGVGEDAFVDPFYREDDSDRPKYSDLEAVHGYRVGRECVEDTEDQEKLKEDGKP